MKIARGERDKKKLTIGVDIPTPDEIRAIIHTATGRIRPLLITAIFSGMRSSELRGLIWDDVDLARGEIHIRRRADRYRTIGRPKSRAGERTIPIGPLVVNALKEHRLSCPRSKLGLVFPNTAGAIWDHADIVSRYVWPTLIAAGVSVPTTDSTGKPLHDKYGHPVMEAKYTGMHALRHFYASWLINRKVDGGLELPIKTVQYRLGHSSITMTSDVYGHLFPRSDDGSEMADAERRLMAVN